MEISLLTPYYSEIAVAVNQMILSENSVNSTRALSGTALTNAINYASTYAYNPNYANYAYFEGEDCTNFTSQILEASGKAQVSGSENSGWWHIITYPYETFYPEYDLGAPVHTHSISWVRADTFARYMGLGSSATNITSLGNLVRRGDFVALDHHSDGDYNHNAFVTAVDSSAATYTDNGISRTYKDFKIAQHSGNYHAYVSSSTNGWEKIEQNGQTATIVGR